MVANNWLKDILNLTIILGRLLPVQHVQLSLLSHGYVDRKTVQLYSSLQLVSFQLVNQIRQDFCHLLMSSAG